MSRMAHGSTLERVTLSEKREQSEKESKEKAEDAVKAKMMGKTARRAW